WSTPCFALQYSRAPTALHSFPTRRSSDLKLFGMDFEVIDVIREAIAMHRLHALAHSPHQTGTFITGKIEATALPQVLEQMLEFRVLFGWWAHPTSPFTTKVTRAEEISSNDRTKSALPVCMAAPGM